MNILGLNAYHGDASAALLAEGAWRLPRGRTFHTLETPGRVPIPGGPHSLAHAG